MPRSHLLLLLTIVAHVAVAKTQSPTGGPSSVVLNRTSVSGECVNMMGSSDADYLSHCCTQAFRGNESILEPIGCPPTANVTCYHIMFWPSPWYFEFTDSTGAMLSPDCIKDLRPPHVFAYRVEASGRTCKLVYDIVEGTIFGLTPNGTTLSPTPRPTARKKNKKKQKKKKKKAKKRKTTG